MTALATTKKRYIYKSTFQQNNSSSQQANWYRHRPHLTTNRFLLSDPTEKNSSLTAPSSLYQHWHQYNRSHTILPLSWQNHSSIHRTDYTIHKINLNANMFLPPKNSIPKTLIRQSRHLLDDDGTGTYDKNIDIQSSTKQSVLSTSRLQRSPVTFKD